MNDGNRNAQVAAGIFAGLVGAAMLLGPVVALEKMPEGAFLWVGGLSLLIGLWLVVPVGMGGLLGEARQAWHEFRGHGEETSDA